VLIPEENIKDLVEIPDNVKNKLDIHPVKWIEQVLALALEREPISLSDEVVAATQPVPVTQEQGSAPTFKH